MYTLILILKKYHSNVNLKKIKNKNNNELNE